MVKAISGLRRNWDRPFFWRQQLLQRFVAPIHKTFDGIERVNVLSKDWDNLIILDACRADLFEEFIDDYAIDGTLSKVHSKGSHSSEFLRQNFRGCDCADTVYVTSNPFAETELNDPFYAIDHVWVDGWDDETGTVMPETVAERTRDAVEKHPNKRLIAHFMQPHSPFVGDVTLDVDGYGLLRAKAMGNNEEHGAREDVWARLSQGEFTIREVWRAYKANLEYVMDVVEELLSDLNGKTVITADHGNAFGEPTWPFGIAAYGHPNGIRTDSVTEVPWFVIDRPRRDTSPGETGDSEVNDRDLVENRLRELGYR